MTDLTPEEAAVEAERMPPEQAERLAEQILPVSIEFMRRHRQIARKVYRTLSRVRGDGTSPAEIDAEVKRAERRARNLRNVTRGGAR